MSVMEKIDVPPPPPGETVPLGSEAHLRLLCKTLIDTHDPYRPALLEWPVPEEETRRKIVSLPIWDRAVATEGRAGMNVRTYSEGVANPLLKAAVQMNAFEKSRHALVLADLVRAYGIELAPEPAYKRPRDPEWAFMRTGYSECIDSFFGFGQFRLAKDTGLFPDALVETFEPVMREEGRHILFFVNWVAWWRRNMPLWRRPWFEAKVVAVWIALILGRLGIGKKTKAQENDLALDGSRERGVEVSFSELGTICLAENDRRLAPYDDRLIRPLLVPAMTRLALRIAGRVKTPTA